MWHEMRRIVAEVQPPFVFAENVSKFAIDVAASDLEQMGYAVKCVELSAADVGADHVRSRFWLCAYANNQNQLLSAVNAKWASCRNFVAAFGMPSPTNQEYLMGWPANWTDLKPLATDKFRRWLQQHGRF